MHVECIRHEHRVFDRIPAPVNQPLYRLAEDEWQDTDTYRPEKKVPVECTDLDNARHDDYRYQQTPECHNFRCTGGGFTLPCCDVVACFVAPSVHVDAPYGQNSLPVAVRPQRVKMPVWTPAPGILWVYSESRAGFRANAATQGNRLVFAFWQLRNLRDSAPDRVSEFQRLTDTESHRRRGLDRPPRERSERGWQHRRFVATTLEGSRRVHRLGQT